MAKISCKNLPIYMTTADAMPLALVPTAITNADPAVVTVADTTGVTDGDLSVPMGTGVHELDTKVFVAGAVVAASFELLGADLDGLAAPPVLGATPRIDVYKQADMVRLCLDNIEIAAATQATIDVGTYCGDGTLPGPVTLGDVTMTGFVDKDDPTYVELLEATREGGERLINIALPGANGFIIGKVAVGAISWGFARDGALSFTVPATQAVAFNHVW